MSRFELPGSCMVVLSFAMMTGAGVIHAATGEMHVDSAAADSAAADSAPTDWPQWRGPHRDGISRETGWSSSGAAEAVWSRALGLGYSSVSIVDGRLYTMGFDKAAGEDVIFCLNAATGRTIWTHRYPAKIWAKYHRGGTLTTPSVDGDVVYTLNREGRYCCLNAKDGSVIIETNLAERFGVTPPTWGFAASPLVLDDMVIANIGRIIAFPKRSTEPIWRSPDLGHAYSTPATLEVRGRSCIAAFNGRGLAVLDRTSGQQIWFHPWKTKYDVNGPTPVPIGDGVFISSGYNHGCAMLKLGGTTPGPEVLWESKVMRNQMTGSVLWQDHLYGFDEATLKCIDLSGDEKWRQRGLGKGAVLVSDGRLIVLSDEGELIIVKATADAYTELSRTDVLDGGVYWTTPVLWNGLIFCRNSEGELTCRDHRNGRSGDAPRGE